MKTKFIQSICTVTFALLAIFNFTSCNNDDDNGSSAPPVIDRVAASVGTDGQPIPLTSTTVGYANNTYIIQGSGFRTLKKVYFNDTDTAFNPNLVTDTNIFVTININTPYANASNKLRVVTQYGEAEYDFVVAPPAPQISSYTSINTNDGDEFTIFGGFFLNPTVTVGTTQATIVSSTLTEIRAIMPAGSQFQKVKVTTISGTAEASQPVGTAIYDDDRASFVENWLGPWDGSGFTVDTDVKSQGLSSIKTVFSAWVGFKIPMYASSPLTSNYSGIRLSVKSTKETGKFKVVLNGNYGGGKVVEFNSNWTSIYVPFSDLGGNPGFVNEIVLQEFNGDGGDTIYIDDVGFVLN
ncbi:IPT/TIG domain-containing protein [Flavobacterium sp. N1719]|uniref:IPT/TIG domain-containing protein n=1 Tax=Flavobacterium sp. N1719 TaxID=2885633 RepID=UPI0022228504|nr:IPT/TIG domain-containing protein [Flavobacterium sp. N1719]